VYFSLPPYSIFPPVPTILFFLISPL
jgi:hypothetical protein